MYYKHYKHNARMHAHVPYTHTISGLDSSQCSMLQHIYRLYKLTYNIDILIYKYILIYIYIFCCRLGGVGMTGDGQK